MTDDPQGLTYADAGVDYAGGLDEFKRFAQQLAAETVDNLEPDRFGGRAVEGTRGESCTLIEYSNRFVGGVLECLGTKALVADKMHELTGHCYYTSIGIDLAAMAFNDLCAAGVRPEWAALYVAVGDSSWFADKERGQHLLQGWKHGCDQAGAYWIGGETPSSKDVIEPGAVDLAAAAGGVIAPKSQRINPATLRSGNAIVMVGSSGIHANGLSMARKVAEATGYDAKLDNGRTFGQALLTPTLIYVKLIQACVRAGIGLTYASNITGHGITKVMRAKQPFVYVLDKVAEPQPEFRFIQEHGPVDLATMYRTFNMGNGLALFLEERDVGWLIKQAGRLGLQAWKAGYVEKQDDLKRVEIPELDLVFEGDELDIR